jgi:hypothetical protein
MTIAVKTEPQSMEQKIAEVLRTPDGVPIRTFELLLKWVDAKIVLTKRDAQEALKASLDPAVIDPGALGRAHDAEHAVKRLENARTALVPHHEAAIRKDELERWKTSTADIRARIADLSKELADVYPPIVTELIALFDRVESLNHEAKQFASAAPTGCGLGSVEGSERIRDVILPRLAGSNTDEWPPKTVPFSIQYSAGVAAMMSSARQPTEAERIAETARVMKFYEDQDAGRIRLNEQAEARDRALEVERRRLRDSGERHQ